MRYILLLTTAALLSSCGQEGQGSNGSNGREHEALTQSVGDADESSVDRLLREGKPEACAHPDVRERILEQVWVEPTKFRSLTDDEWEEFVSRAADPNLSALQATDVDAGAGEVSCEVDIEIGRSPRTQPYKVRRSLGDEDSFVLRGNFYEARDIYQLQITGPASHPAGLREHARSIEDQNMRDALEYSQADPEMQACFDRAGLDPNEKNACRSGPMPEASAAVPKPAPRPPSRSDEEY